jgi:hypothetical protein
MRAQRSHMNQQYLDWLKTERTEGRVPFDPVEYERVEKRIAEIWALPSWKIHGCSRRKAKPMSKEQIQAYRDELAKLHEIKAAMDGRGDFATYWFTRPEYYS